MDKKGIVPTIIGLALGLGVLYVTVLVVSKGWRSGQK